MLEVDSLRVQEISIYISQWITHVVKWYRKIQSKFSLNTVAYKCWCLPFAKTEILVSRLKSASHLEICIYLSFFLTKILLCYFLQKSSEINQVFISDHQTISKCLAAGLDSLMMAFQFLTIRRINMFDIWTRFRRV